MAQVQPEPQPLSFSHDYLAGLRENPYTIVRRSGHVLVVDTRVADLKRVILSNRQHDERRLGVMSAIPGGDASAMMRAAARAISYYRDALQVRLIALEAEREAAIEEERVAYADCTWAPSPDAITNARGHLARIAMQSERDVIHTAWDIAVQNREEIDQALLEARRCLESVVWREEDAARLLYDGYRSQAGRDTPRL